MSARYCKLGIVVSWIIVLLGILTLTGALGGDTGISSSATLYDSGYASFGADFYTYVSNNAAEAAIASRKVASNLNEIASLIKNLFGYGFIASGLLCFCHFGILLADHPVSNITAEQNSQNKDFSINPEIKEDVEIQEESVATSDSVAFESDISPNKLEE